MLLPWFVGQVRESNAWVRARRVERFQARARGRAVTTRFLPLRFAS
jgi:hypothetical protein